MPCVRVKAGSSKDAADACAVLCTWLFIMWLTVDQLCATHAAHHKLHFLPRHAGATAARAATAVEGGFNK